MTVHVLSMQRIIFDDASEQLTFEMRVDPPTAPAPSGINASNIYPQAGPTVSFSVRAKKWPDMTFTALAVKAGTDGDEWFRYTFKGGSWVDPVRIEVDENGNPL